ncbi:hypothetical protein E4U55_000874, partial [Claviceps digitariae]
MPPSDPLNPYKDLYVHPNGPGDVRPTARQVLNDIIPSGSTSVSNPWSGRVILVTGGTAGIGLETVRELYRTGADVFFTARNLDKAAGVRAQILEEDDGEGAARGRLEFVEMDLDSLDSVRRAAEEFLRKSERLNILINNA